VAVALVAWRVAVAPSMSNAQIVGITGGLGCLLLVVALAAPAPEAIPWGLACLAASYGLGLPVHAGSADQAAAYGIALLAAAELGYASLNARTAVGGEPGTRRIRVSALLGVVAATLVLDQVTVGSARVSTGDASLLVLATAGIVVLVAAIAVMVAGRRPDGND
jgi:hypothetical protein